MAKTLPKHHTWDTVIAWFGHWASMVAVAIDIVVLPPMVCKYAKLSGIKSSMLLMTARMANAWLISSVMTMLLHENCAAGWKWSWAVCATGRNGFDVEIDNVKLLNTSKDICRAPIHWWKQGRCSRALVETLTPLFLQKAILRVFFLPVDTLALWLLYVQDG